MYDRKTNRQFVLENIIPSVTNNYNNNLKSIDRGVFLRSIRPHHPRNIRGFLFFYCARKTVQRYCTACFTIIGDEPTRYIIILYLLCRAYTCCCGGYTCCGAISRAANNERHAVSSMSLVFPRAEDGVLGRSQPNTVVWFN